MLGLWLLVVLAVEVRCLKVRKCCGQDASLHVGQDLMCKKSLHEWFYANFSYGLPNDCNLNTARFYIAEKDSTASCIDNLNATDTIVSIRCEANRQDFSIPNVHYLRKCCPFNRTYDSIIQSCWSSQTDSWPSAFLNTLMYNAEGVLDIEYGVPKCGPNHVVVDHLLTLDQVVRLPTASIKYIYGNTEYVRNPDEVCVDRTERRDVLIVRSCEQENTACINNTCIRKCCQEDYSYNYSRSCKHTRSNIRPLPVYNKTDGGLVAVEHRNPAYWYDLTCEKYREYPTSWYNLALDGSIYNKMENLWTETGQFCIEKVADSNGEDTFAFFCFNDGDVEPNVHIWTTTGMLVSSFFLFLTFLVYAILPSLKNLHGKTLMCHAACLLTAYSCLSIVQLVTDQLLDRVCLILGYITLFSFLAAFFWLNIISFDIWWTFGSMRPMMNRKRREMRRFVAYSAYAWIIPVIITSSSAVADRLDIFPPYLKPGIGNESCWFTGTTYGLFLFFDGPVGILLTVNLVFFILTARHCAKVKSDLDKVGHTPIADNKFKSDKSRLVMNGKLFVAMGINWGLEFLSAVIHRSSWLPTEIWYLPDMCNACQGLVIFWIFVMKRRTLIELRRRLEELVCCFKPPPRQPSVSTLFSGNTTSSTEINAHHLMKKSLSETRLSPLPIVKHNHLLNLKNKSKSTNRLFV